LLRAIRKDRPFGVEKAQEHNLLGQKLGPKGRQVRDRLLAAARDLMASQPMSAPTLTAVTAAADVRLTSVYRYYADAGALYIAAMGPFRSQMTPLIALLERPWRKGSEFAEAQRFAEQHFAYWRDRRGALFLRNSLAEGGDARFIALRTDWALPLYRALAEKLAAGHGRAVGGDDMAVAGVVLSGMERTTTLALQHWEEEGHASHSAVLRHAARQQAAVARIVTTLLRYDYLGI
jgi:AcrR family transcriptional regulator